VPAGRLPSPPPPTRANPDPAARRRRVTYGQWRYECPGCGERLAGERRCPDYTLFARRLGEGGCCPTCNEIITINELLNIQ